MILYTFCENYKHNMYTVQSFVFEVQNQNRLYGITIPFLRKHFRNSLIYFFRLFCKVAIGNYSTIGTGKSTLLTGESVQRSSID